MKYLNPLDQGIFLKRYKRFFADVDWNGSMLVAHLPNTGSLRGVNSPGQPCLFSHSTNPSRKLKQTLEMIQAASGCWVGVNTSTPNLVVKNCLERIFNSKLQISESGDQEASPKASTNNWPEAWQHWLEFDSVKPEFKISAETRLDFALKKEGHEQMHFIEVKSVTMSEGKTAMFPDSETTRGQKHLQDLMNLVDQGHTAEILFAVQRADCEEFAPAADIDSEYARLLRLAEKKGVRLSPFVVELCPKQAVLASRMLSLNL